MLCFSVPFVFVYIQYFLIIPSPRLLFPWRTNRRGTRRYTWPRKRVTPKSLSCCSNIRPRRTRLIRWKKNTFTTTTIVCLCMLCFSVSLFKYKTYEWLVWYYILHTFFMRGLFLPVFVYIYYVWFMHNLFLAFFACIYFAHVDVSNVGTMQNQNRFGVGESRA